MNERGVVLGQDYPLPLVNTGAVFESISSSSRGRSKMEGGNKGTSTRSVDLPSMKSLPIGSYQFDQK